MESSLDNDGGYVGTTAREKIRIYGESSPSQWRWFYMGTVCSLIMIDGLKHRVATTIARVELMSRREPKGFHIQMNYILSGDIPEELVRV